MRVQRVGSLPSMSGPADWFTGAVRIDPLFQSDEPARASGAAVTFEPGARTAWHAHPFGQRDRRGHDPSLGGRRRPARIDAMFNNAGVMPTANLSEVHRDEWRMMLEINIMGVLNGIAAVLPTMKEQKSGHIIATDSVAGHVVYPGSAVYCGTKFAVRAIMEGLRQEERENNIRSTIISPGLVNTELYTTISDKRLGESLKNASQIPGIGLTSEDIADAVAYAVGTPETVAVSEIIIRPTKQAI